MRNRSFFIATGLIFLAILILCLCGRKVPPLSIEDARFAGGVVSGILIDSKGNPIPGADVTVLPSGKITITDNNGNFTLSDIHDDQVTLIFRSPDYLESRTLPYSLRMGEIKQLDTVGKLISRYGRLRGQIRVDPPLVDDFTLPAGIQVVDQPATASSLIDGSFYPMKVEPGLLKVYGVKHGVGFGVVWAQVNAGDTTITTIPINLRGGTVTGTVVESSSPSLAKLRTAGFVPVADAVVSAIGGIIADTTNISGKFVLTEVPTDGRVTITIRKDGKLLMVAGVLAIEGDTVDLDTLPLGTPATKNGILLLPGIANAVLGDSITVQVGAEGDSVKGINGYKWATGSDTTWTSTLYPVKKFLFTKAGKDTIRVKAVLMSGAESNETQIIVTVKSLDLPQIGSSPVSLARQADSTATFSVSVINGGGKYRYVWLHRVPAGTTDFRWDTVASKESLDAGNLFTVITSGLTAGWYRVSVSNAKGSCMSDSAELTLLEPPRITIQPLSQVGVPNQPITLTINAAGTAPFTYIWKLGSTVRQTVLQSVRFSDTLMIPSLSPQDTGTWSCEVSNSIGAATSAATSVTFSTVKPSIGTQPKSAAILDGAPIALRVTAAGSSPFTFVWQLNGTTRDSSVALFGVVSDTLRIALLSASDTGTWTVIVSNSAGGATSAGAHISLVPISLVISATNGGTIAKTPDLATYKYGDTVKISASGQKAVPAIPFRHWGGTIKSQRDTVAFLADTFVIMDTSKTVSAAFGYYINATGINGTVTKTKDQELYAAGVAVQLSAQAKTGCHFVKWNTLGHITPVTVSIPTQGGKDRYDTALFVPDDGSLLTVQTAGSAGNLNAVLFADAQNGMIAGDTANGRGTCFYTVNGGTAWTRETFRAASPALNALCQPATGVWVAAGDSGALAHKSAGTAYWTRPANSSLQPLRGIAFVNASSGFAVGDHGTLVQTSDTGKTWLSPTSLLGTKSSLTAISFFPGTQKGVLTSIDGGIFTFTNAGNYWVATAAAGAPTATGFYGVCCLSATEAVAVGASGSIYHSLNGGSAWTALPSGTNRFMYAIAAVGPSRNTLIAVGDFGTVLKSTDNGASWQEMASGTNTPLRSVSTSGTNEFTVVGDAGTVLRYYLP